MENEVVKIVFIGLGVIAPISYGLFSRVLKDRDEKFKTLFEKYDKMNEKMEQVEKDVGIIQSDIEWIRDGKKQD